MGWPKGKPRKVKAENIHSESGVIQGGSKAKVGQNPLTRGANPLTGTDSNPLPAHYHDENVAKRAAAAEANGPRVEVIRDDWDNYIDSRYDEELEIKSVFETAAEPYKEKDPGSDFRWLSPKVLERRGDRGWEMVENPKTKGQVKAAGMILAKMPKEKTAARRRRNLQEHADRVRDINERNLDSLAKAGRDSRGGIEPLNLMK